MKKHSAYLLFFILAAVVFAADDRFTPAVVEPTGDAAAFPQRLRYKEPKVVFAPAVVYPIEMHSGIRGEVILYVKIDRRGYPRRIAVFGSSQHVFERYAVANAMQTIWAASEQTDPRGWFELEIIFQAEP